MRKSQFSVNKRWGYVLAIASVAVIAIATLNPFNFTVPQDSSLATIVKQFERTSHLQDYSNNILLFMPWGYSLAWILPPKKLTKAGILALAVISSLMLTLTVETTQYFLPARVSNLADVTTNTIGGGVGALVYFWRHQIYSFCAAILARNRHLLTPKSVALVFVGYFALIYLIIFSLLANVNVNNWNSNFPLIVGNEATGDRPWEGKISQLHISDRALSVSALNDVFQQQEAFWLESGNSIASYLFDGANEDRYITNAIDREPVLVWQDSAKLEPDTLSNPSKGVIINRDRWLMTSDSVSTIINKIKQNNQFTISAVFATEKFEQPEHSRIVSISNSPFYRNLTIAQKQQDLILRLRTPVTDENGAEPEMLIPNVFKDFDFHHLIVMFDGNKITSYVDRPENEYSFDFGSEVTFWSWLPLKIPRRVINLDNLKESLYKFNFYLAIFLPLGLLGGLLLSLFNRHKTTQLLLLLLFGLLPALLIEQLNIVLASEPIRAFDLLLSIGILLSATLLSTTLLFKNPAYKMR